MRQNDGLLPTFPIWNDARTFDGNPWRGRLLTWFLGFCQDISGGSVSRNRRRKKWALARNGKIIDEARPQYAFVEKTHLCLWEEDFAVVLPVTLPKWGLMQDGVLGTPRSRTPHEKNVAGVVANARENRRFAVGGA